MEDGKVKVKASKTALKTQKRIREMTCGSPEEEKTYLIVGGGKCRAGWRVGGRADGWVDAEKRIREMTFGSPEEEVSIEQAGR